jgi:hypothetical protein
MECSNPFCRIIESIDGRKHMNLILPFPLAVLQESELSLMQKFVWALVHVQNLQNNYIIREKDICDYLSINNGNYYSTMNSLEKLGWVIVYRKDGFIREVRAVVKTTELERLVDQYTNAQKLIEKKHATV